MAEVLSNRGVAEVVEGNTIFEESMSPFLASHVLNFLKPICKCKMETFLICY